jgi:hypothetical protein
MEKDKEVDMRRVTEIYNKEKAYWDTAAGRASDEIMSLLIEEICWGVQSRAGRDIPDCIWSRIWKKSTKVGRWI